MNATLRLGTAVAAVVVVLLGTQSALAGTASRRTTSTRAATLTRAPAKQGAGYTATLLAKAAPDECFNGIGQPYPVGPPCAEGQPKVNQAYVWGMTKVGGDIWFGTGANIHCLVGGATLDTPIPVVNSDYVCEYAKSQTLRDDPTWPASIGDQRTPQVWLYNAESKTSVNLSDEINAKSADDATRLRTTIGLRAAGNLGGVVLLGGPATNNSLNLFAFDAASHEFIGSRNLPQYGNIRTFLTADDALYLGVGVGRNGADGGGVLRWTGDLSNPFSFEIVANLPVQAADLAAYDGRIAITSWQGSQHTGPEQFAGVWVSPKLSDGEPGLNPEDADKWTQAWNSGMYEPDPIVNLTYGGGGIASFDGYLYWGTMHVPMKAYRVFESRYPQTTTDGKADQLLNTQRAISIWRGKDLGTPDAKIELLYGETALPAYDAGTASWSVKSTGWTPVYGKSGFDTPFNNYTWRMAVADGKLFVGTMDWSYLVQDIFRRIPGKPGTASKLGAGLIDDQSYGGDLWMFPSAAAKAEPISTNGLGNYLNYGIRNMVVDGSDLYVGMANPMNLRTDPTDNVPEGGWELIKLAKTVAP
ncbi:MAG: hypothetical protein QOH97_774 [Actinoplanes sp.]|nr:hypothetical protein [Actinoplanes sp.]